MGMAGFNGTRQIIDVPGNAGAFVPIVATGPLRFMRVTESLVTSAGAANAQTGFNYKIANDGTANGFGQVFGVAAGGTTPYGDPQAEHSRDGSVLGNGPDDIVGTNAGANARPATVLMAIRGAAVGGTSVEVSQYY